MVSVSARQHINWQQVDRAARRIAHQLVPSTKFQLIIGVGNGGIIPAALIGYYYTLKSYRPIDIKVINAASYNNEERGTLAVAWPPTETIDQVNQLGNRVLIVDDITDSGVTLATFKDRFPAAKSAVLVHKIASSFKPDYYGVEGTDLWYVFPWEKQRG